MIKYLDKQEKSLTKSLYKEAFFEDSDSFIDYYYNEKLKDNRILADLEGDEIRSMVMLNPYDIVVFQKKYRLDYIVAVATGENYKRQGYMRKLLNKALLDMNSAKVPFTYLIPANKDYYLPFDFTFVAKKNEYTGDLMKLSVIKDKIPDENSIEKILDFINSEVSKDNDVYTFRDINYFKREILELASEDGFINIYSDEGGIAAYESFWGREKKELKERIISSNISKREYGKDNIMARITDVKELLSGFRSSRPLDMIIKLNDKIIDAQNGFFRIEMDKNSSIISRLENIPKNSGFIEFEIADFTSWIFGYQDNPKCKFVDFEDKKELQYINRISGIFINEYV